VKKEVEVMDLCSPEKSSL